MGAGGYFTLAVLVTVLIPAVALSVEGRKVPGFVYPAIAGCGLVSSVLRGGLAGLGQSVAAALVTLLLIGAAITVLRAATRLRILTGGQIKLMAAGATWLGLVGSLVMIVVAAFGLFAFAVLHQAGDGQRRPQSALIVVLAIMFVAFQQQITWHT